MPLTGLGEGPCMEGNKEENRGREADDHPPPLPVSSMTLANKDK